MRTALSRCRLLTTKVIVGPVPAVLPVALTIYARPFGEPTLFKVASAYERAFPEVRVPPPDFGPLSGEP